MNRTLFQASNIAPVGSLCVAYISTATIGRRQSTLEYFSQLKGPGSRGTLAITPISSNCYEHKKLLAVRPDRLLYLSSHAGSIIDDAEIYRGRKPSVYTRPLLPLEPLVSNYLARIQEGLPKDFSTLKALIERFVNFSNLDNNLDEGLGKLGVGVTCNILSMLRHHGFPDLTEYLLIDDYKSTPSEAKTLLPWIPYWSTIKLSSRYYDTVSNRFTRDFRSADHFAGSDVHESPIPLPSDPLSSLSRLTAQLSLSVKELFEAVALLDSAGDYYSNETIVILALSTQHEDAVSELNAHNEGSHADRASCTPLASLSKYLQLSHNVDLRASDKEPEGLRNIVQKFSLTFQKGINKLYPTRDSLSCTLLDTWFRKRPSPDISDASLIDMSNEKNIW
jgi:hypothetical protein